MQPMRVLQFVRLGFALATVEQAGIVSPCRDLQVVDGGWVPRWALEAETALETAGYAPTRIRHLFALGRDRVFFELDALVRTGRRASVLESRLPYQCSAIDRPTQAALVTALRSHRGECSRCRRAEPCLEGDELAEELELLFPHERRKHSRA
jgi:hypothetical protein